MKVAGSHAVMLLARLNRQREVAQFCDCVVKPRQNPGHLHPAHRCVLAASSPVLASLLSSAGALVELKAPCLSDAVLAILLDFMYTGALPYSCNQHQYYNLLIAASYLQMDELQEALKTVNNVSMCLPLSLRKEDNQYSTDVNTCDESENGPKRRDKKHASCLRSANTCCSTSGSSISTGNCRQVTYLTPQDLIQNTACMAEMCRVCGVDKEVQKDPLHPARCHSVGTEEELQKTAEDRRSSFLPCSAEVQEEETRGAEKKHQLSLTICHFKDSFLPFHCSSPSSASSSSPHLYSGAVPVICHSSRAAMLKLATIPHLYHGVSQASVSSSRAPDSHEGSSDIMAEGVSAKHKHLYESAYCFDQYNRERKHRNGTQIWDYKDSSEHFEVLKQDSNSSNRHNLIGRNDDHMSNALPKMTDHNDCLAHCDSFPSKNQIKHFGDDSVSQSKNCFTRGSQDETDLSSDDFSSKHRRLDFCEWQNVCMATAAQEQSIHAQHPRALVPPPVHNFVMGGDSLCGDLSSEGGAKEEHSSAETHMQTSHCTTEPHLRFTMSVDHNMSQPVHSDQSSDEEEVGAFARPRYSPRRQISATGTTDQILLPDFGAKPADSRVAKACSQKETFPNSFWNNEEAAWNEVISVAQFDTKYWIGETHFDARSVGTERSRPGAEVMRAEVVSIGNQSATLRVRSPPGVPASVSSALPACVPSSPPTSVPAHPSNPVQPPFRCSLCARPFSQRGSLNRHVRSHLGVRPFSCPRCPMTFSRQYRVTEHMRVHQRFVLRSDFRPASSI